jgi:hypothetical protein
MDDGNAGVNLSEMPEPEMPSRTRKSLRLFSFLKYKHVSLSTFISIVLAFAIGLSSGYLAWGRESMAVESTASSAPSVTPTAEHDHSVTLDIAAIGKQINPPEGYALPVTYGNLGPQLLNAGAIDYDRFAKVYVDAGQPLTDDQLAILKQGSRDSIVINRDNAYFLLNFFWAVGLTNQNAILTQGPMMKNGQDQIGNFASTGGWTIGARLPVELYASTALITLTSEQQARLENVAQNVFRPCCNNPTHFPDCNHGMAMLGLLEALAAQNATESEMFTAAKYANAFWYPQQSLEQAVMFKAAQNLNVDQVDAREWVSLNFSSAAGFKNVHQWLADNGLLKSGPNGGNSCGV